MSDNCGNERGKARRDDGDIVGARRKCEGVVACGVRTGVGLGKFGGLVGLNVDDSAGDDSTRGVGDETGKDAGLRGFLRVNS